MIRKIVNNNLTKNRFLQLKALRKMLIVCCSIYNNLTKILKIMFAQ